MASRGANWVLPTTYTNGEAILPADQAKIVTHIFMDGVEVGVSSPGATQWDGEIDMVQGQSYKFTATCEINGLFSVASPEVTFTVPFFPPNPPTNLAIS
jgi:hypothetical protein